MGTKPCRREPGKAEHQARRDAEQHAERAETLAQLVTPELANLLVLLAAGTEYRPSLDDAKAARELAARIRETLEPRMEMFPNIEALLEKLISAMRASDREADEGGEDGRTSDFYRGKANAFWACYVQLKQALEADTH